MLNKKPDITRTRVWIELERTPNHEFNERQAALATRMLERLADPKDLPLNAGFSWSRHEALYHYGGPMGYHTLKDDGEWFNLEYFGRASDRVRMTPT